MAFMSEEETSESAGQGFWRKLEESACCRYRKCGTYVHSVVAFFANTSL